MQRRGGGGGAGQSESDTRSTTTWSESWRAFLKRSSSSSSIMRRRSAWSSSSCLLRSSTSAVIQGRLSSSTKSPGRRPARPARGASSCGSIFGGGSCEPEELPCSKRRSYSSTSRRKNAGGGVRPMFVHLREPRLRPASEATRLLRSSLEVARRFRSSSRFPPPPRRVIERPPLHIVFRRCRICTRRGCLWSPAASEWWRRRI